MSILDDLFERVDINFLDIFRGGIQALQNIDQDIKALTAVEQQRLQVETQILAVMRMGQLPAARLVFHLGPAQKQ